jgi:hypothetical protein
MAKKTLKIITPDGVFTRTTNTAYTHAVVRRSERAYEAYINPRYKSGVQGRWIKDRGFGVTWHGSEQAAQAAARKPYGWDGSIDVVGIYPAVEA